MKKLIAICTIATIVLALSGISMAGTIYSLTPFTGYTSINVTAINDSGMAVGYCENSSGSLLMSFVWTEATGMVQLQSQTYARAINNNGMIVGDNKNGDSLYWTSSTATAQTITAAGTNGGIAQGINDQGQIVGRTGYTAANPRVGYVWDSASGITKISGSQEAKAINDSGEVVGNQRFRWDSTNGLTTIGLTGDTWGIVAAINDEGTAVGNLGKTGGFMQTSDGTITALGTLEGYTGSYARGINELNQIVGDLDYGKAAFLYEDGIIVELNSLLEQGSGWDLLYANSINESGWIAGTGKLNGQSVGYVMTPEPTTIAILGLGALILRRKRRAA